MRILKRVTIRKQEGPGTFSFRGRAGRWEYGRLVIGGSIIAAIWSSTPGGGLVSSLMVAIVVAAVTARRLHDLSWTGWLQLVPIIPFFIALVIALPIGVGAKPEAAILDLMSPQNFSSTDFGRLFLQGSLIFWAIFQVWLLFTPGGKDPNVYGEGA